MGSIIDVVFPDGSPAKQWLKSHLLEPAIPAAITANYILPDDAGIQRVEESLGTNYFSREVDGYLHTEAGAKDLYDHLTGRLGNDRRLAVPWLESVQPLAGLRVLEIGCGTGASTVALAEQGARVTAIDVDDLALKDAVTRCAVYGVEVDFHLMNSTEAAETFSDQTFDLIVFWACLEHMTHEERMSAMASTWKMLRPGGLWGVIGTPNRLHFYDSHTSMMPFYHWLPDDLAMKYAQFSPREKFNQQPWAGDQHDNDFFRWGRGLSFHEFELTMRPVAELEVVSCMTLYGRSQRMASQLKARLTTDFRYESLLHSRFPWIHRGFFQPYLNLLIRKN